MKKETNNVEPLYWEIAKEKIDTLLSRGFTFHFLAHPKDKPSEALDHISIPFGISDQGFLKLLDDYLAAPGKYGPLAARAKSHIYFNDLKTVK